MWAFLFKKILDKLNFKINFAIQSTFNMSNSNHNLNDLAHIRQLMERSTKFVSLSGLSGVFAGTYALLGAFGVWFFINVVGITHCIGEDGVAMKLFGLKFQEFCFADALLVLFLSLSTSFWLSYKKANQLGETIWNSLTRRVFINMMVPLATGGIFCLLLIYHRQSIFIAPATLIFYGLALVNVSKYTYNDIFQLGIIEILIGLLAMFFLANGLLFWTIGFGLMHIIYGIGMYFKYERKQA